MGRRRPPESYGQIKGHDVHPLLFEKWIVAHLEPDGAVRFETILPPNSPHRALAHPGGLGHGGPTPVRGIDGLLLGCLLENLLALHGDHPRLSAPTWAFLLEAIETRFLPTLEALPCGSVITSQRLAYDAEGLARCPMKHNLGAQDTSRRMGPAPRHFLETPCLFPS